MSKDPTEPLANAVRPTLAGGEQVRLASRIRTDPGTVEDVDVRTELVEVLNPLNWIGIGAHPGGFLRRLTFGRAVVGRGGSMARVLHGAIDSTPDAALVITDGRLIAMAVTVNISGSTVAYQPGKVVAECPRAAVTGAQLAAKGVLRRARFTVSFGDGSRCALLAQVPSVARRLVDELNTAWPNG
jgi:hypothetical protein